MFADIPRSSTLKGIPVTTTTRKPDIDHSMTNSILALFELAATQTPDPDLVRHIRQVIASKRGFLGYSRNIPSTILDTHPGFEQENIWPVPPKYLLRPLLTS
jgi:hypothetical protein